MNGDCDVINRLLNETMHMDFPFLAGEDKKKRIVEDKKIYIEDTIKEAFAEMYPEKLELNKLWNEALDYAGSKFDSLPVSKRLNGFYLQELMHRYVIIELDGGCLPVTQFKAGSR